MPPTDRPLRVLHLTAGSDPGGVSRYLFDLATAMQRNGHVVRIAGERGTWHNLFENSDLNWMELPMKRGPLGLWSAGRALLQQIAHDPIDLVHAHYRRAALVGRRIAREAGVPLLFTLHLTGIRMDGLFGRFSEFGDHTHTPSAEGKRWLAEACGVDERRITVIPHGVEASRYPVVDDRQRAEARALLKLPADALIAAFVGRYDDPKNPRWMLDLAEASRDRLPHLHVVMVGGGPLSRALTDEVRKRHLKGRVTLMSYGDPTSVYRAADAVLLPSSLEGFSLVTTEAMCMGRPVLRTNTAGTAEQIVENETGRSVAIDHDAFIAAALEFLSDPAELARMGRNAAEFIRQNLTFNRQFDQTIALYHRLIGK